MKTFEKFKNDINEHKSNTKNIDYEIIELAKKLSIKHKNALDKLKNDEQ